MGIYKEDVDISHDPGFSGATVSAIQGPDHENSYAESNLKDNATCLEEYRIIAARQDCHPSIHHFPVEIIEEILMICTPCLPQQSYSSPGPLPGAFMVCKQWWTIACALPKLWSTIVLPLYSYSRFPQGPSSFLQRCLTRSKNAPISFNILILSNDLASNTEPLRLLIRHCHLWKEASFSPTIKAGDHLRLQGNLPLLEKLELKRCGISISIAPKLRSLSLICLNPSYDVGYLELPWSQITHFKSFGNDPRFLFHVIRLMPNLCKLETDSTVSDAPENTDAGYLLHSNLQELSINSIRAPTPLLRALNAPRLDTVTLGKHFDASFLTGFVVDIAALISRSNCPLRRLRIYNTPFADIMEIFANIHPTLTLTHISFSHPALSRKVFRSAQEYFRNEESPSLSIAALGVRSLQQDSLHGLIEAVDAISINEDHTLFKKREIFSGFVEFTLVDSGESSAEKSGIPVMVGESTINMWKIFYNPETASNSL